VLTLRSWRDADRIINAAEGAQRVALIGGSFIGMEVASSLKQRGVEEIHVIAPERVTFGSVLGEQVGRVLMRLHEENGIVFHLGHTPEEVRGGTRASSVLLDDGTAVAADLVIIGVGVKPATDMIRGATLEADGSLRVESDLRVAEGVYAAGDIATFPHPLTGAPTRVEHWRLAQQHGEVAARNMAGQAASFDRVPFFWTMQHGMPLNYVGHAAKWDEIIIDGDLGQREFIAYSVSQGRVLAASGMGRDKQLDALHELFLRGAVPAPSELRGEGVDLVARLAAG
jgi:NADPH-dependent 2,4-dienoyl-CoA reductase/sulfur reductase-like enzyme